MLDHVLCGSVKLCPMYSMRMASRPEAVPPTGTAPVRRIPSISISPGGTTATNSVHDAPGFHDISKGWTYNLDLTFEGKLINVTTGNRAGNEIWTTTGSKQTMENAGHDGDVGLQPDDR